MSKVQCFKKTIKLQRAKESLTLKKAIWGLIWTLCFKNQVAAVKYSDESGKLLIYI